MPYHSLSTYERCIRDSSYSFIVILRSVSHVERFEAVPSLIPPGLGVLEFHRHSGLIHQVIILQILRGETAAPGTAANGNRLADTIVVASSGLVDVEASHRNSFGSILDMQMCIRDRFSAL